MTTHRILYIITKSELGGAQAHVLDLIKGFHPRYDVHLAVGVEGPLTEAAKAFNVRVHLLPNLQRSIDPVTDLRAVRECITLIRGINPDLVHVHSSKAGIIGRCSGRIANVPTIFTAHGWGFSPGTPLARRIVALLSEKFAAVLAEKIICVSESDRRLALRFGIGNSRSLETIHYGLVTNPFPVANPLLQPPRFIMVARFNEQKDQQTLLKAFAQLQYTGTHLDFVGSGPSLEECKALAQSLGVTNNVSFLGDRHDVPTLLAQAQGFVLSTHYEGLPISILEAMRAGLPVIATGVSGIPEEVQHGETGLLVPHGDVQALVRALERIVGSPDLRRRMGEAGRQNFLKEFTLERMLDQTEIIYQQTLVARRRICTSSG
jgi:glycosyltransferase involved in cell wall biosynthesis